MRDLTFSFFYCFSFFIIASGGVAACTLPEGGSHARCGAESVCAQGLVCYRTFCIEPSQAADGSMVGGDGAQGLPDVDAQVFDAAQPKPGDALPPSTSVDAAAPSDAGSTPAQPDAGVSEPDAQVSKPDAQVAQPDAQVAQPDASVPVDAGEPQDAGTTPCKGKKCCKGGKPQPCKDD